MATTTYRFLQHNGQASVFANPANLKNTFSTKVSTFTPRLKKTLVTNVDLAVNKPVEIVDECDSCVKELITEAARLSLSGRQNSVASIRALVAELNAYVASAQFEANWLGFQNNPTDLINITV